MQMDYKTLTKSRKLLSKALALLQTVEAKAGSKHQKNSANLLHDIDREIKAQETATYAKKQFL